MDGIAVCKQAQLEMFGDARPELVDELTTPDVIDHGAPPDGTRGREALKDTIRWIHSGLDDVGYEVKDRLSERRQGRDSLHSSRR